MAPFFAAPQEVSQMAMPLRQTIKVATYLFEHKLRTRDKCPLIVELETLRDLAAKTWPASTPTPVRFTSWWPTI